MAITIGDLANETGVKTRTIRFYEEKGLLPRPRRSESGYRLYSEQDIKLLRLVRSARSLGLSIRDVGGLLATAEHNSCGSFRGQAARLIVDKLEQVEASIKEMEALKEDLSMAMKNLSDAAEGCETGVLECTDCRCLGEPVGIIRERGGESGG